MSNTGSNLYAQGYGTTSSVSFPGNAVVFQRNPIQTDISNGTGLYSIGQLWVNEAGSSSWQLTGFTSSNGVVGAVWIPLGGSGTLETLTGNSGSAATPSGGNIDVVGTGSITTVSGGSTVTIEIVGGGGIISELTGNTGGAITPTGSPPNVNILGAGALSFAGIASPATLTGTITPSTFLVSRLNGDTGTASPADVAGQGIITIAGGTGISTAASGPNTITISTTGGGSAWTDEAVSFTAAVNTGYFITAASVIATLPTSAANGSDISFVSLVSSTFTIQAGAGQQIRIGASISSVAGSATTTQIGDSLELAYNSASSTWVALSAPEGAWSTV